jgi:flagellar capping protein FliD
VSDTSTSTSKDTSKVLANIESGAEELTDTAKELYTRSNNKVFSKDASGDYDTEKIYEKVSDFVEGYNTLLTAASKSSTSTIGNALSSMTNLTKNNSDALSEIGISINSKTSTLSIEEDTFKASDMDKVKSLFNGTGSYAYGVATQSAMIDSYAQTEASRSNTYSSSGTYTYNYSSGSILSEMF